MDNARNQVENLFDALDVKMDRRGRKYMGSCPVHGGKSRDSLNFYPDGTRGSSFWHCLSHHCERHFRGNLIGFVRGVLSHQNHMWEGPGDEEVSFKDALEWLCGFLDTPWETIKPDLSLAERNQFLANVEILTLATESRIQKGICSRNKLRRFIEIPSQYYLSRGFSPEILDRYDVGLCQRPESKLYGRVVIPFYDDDREYMNGCIGRSTHQQCPKCKFYHPRDIDCQVPGILINKKEYAKVIPRDNFKPGNSLYNYWFAKDDILKTRCVVVVEGCADVWRLVESGITNVVALNGSDMSEPQQIALECSGATEIVCLTDNDEAGERAYEQITKRCWFAEVSRPTYEGKDIGELDTDRLKQYDFHKRLKEKLGLEAGE